MLDSFFFKAGTSNLLPDETKQMKPFAFNMIMYNSFISLSTHFLSLQIKMRLN